MVSVPPPLNETPSAPADWVAGSAVVAVTVMVLLLIVPSPLLKLTMPCIPMASIAGSDSTPVPVTVLLVRVKVAPFSRSNTAPCLSPCNSGVDTTGPEAVPLSVTPVP